MSAMAPQITSLTIVNSTVYSGAHKIKHESSASLAFVRVIHRLAVNSPHKLPVTRKKNSIWWRHHEIFYLFKADWLVRTHVSKLGYILFLKWFVACLTQAIIWSNSILSQIGLKNTHTSVKWINAIYLPIFYRVGLTRIWANRNVKQSWKVLEKSTSVHSPYQSTTKCKSCTWLFSSNIAKTPELKQVWERIKISSHTF